MPKTDNVITKDYLDKRLNQFKTELKTELGEELKGELYEIKDEIVGEIKAMREEFDTHQYSHTRINDDFQDHDQRISKLESPQKS